MLASVHAAAHAPVKRSPNVVNDIGTKKTPVLTDGGFFFPSRQICHGVKCAHPQVPPSRCHRPRANVPPRSIGDGSRAGRLRVVTELLRPPHSGPQGRYTPAEVPRTGISPLAPRGVIKDPPRVADRRRAAPGRECLHNLPRHDGVHEPASCDQPTCARRATSR